MRKRLTCFSCAYYHDINWDKLLEEWKKSLEIEDRPIITAESASKLIKKGREKKEEIIGLCVLRNKRMIETCRYFTHPISDIPPETRLKYHTMHKERYYLSLTFIVSVIAIVISILALSIG